MSQPTREQRGRYMFIQFRMIMKWDAFVLSGREGNIPEDEFFTPDEVYEASKQLTDDQVESYACLDDILHLCEVDEAISWVRHPFKFKVEPWDGKGSTVAKGSTE